MARPLIVIDNPSDLGELAERYPVVAVRDYLTGDDYQNERKLLVVNLCANHRYLGTAYYCSLLAEARRQRVLPSVKTMLELDRPRAYGLDTGELNQLAQRVLRRRTTSAPEITGFAMEVYFGECENEALRELARALFEAFPAPLLRVEFSKQDAWRIASVKPLPLARLDERQREAFAAALEGHLRRRPRSGRGRPAKRYDLAILHDPEEKLAPSSPRALKYFVEAAKGVGIEAELITRKELHRLAEYDALFIRTTTRIDHYTYRAAKRAHKEGMVVIDDPDSILKCTNKVFLAELLRGARVPTPKTAVVSRRTLAEAEREIGFPVVLKIPDGSFSRGVHKAEDGQQMREIAAKLFKESDLILAQEYMYTDFDWRVGLLDGQPLYVSQYFMSKAHWQIVQHGENGKFEEGGFRTLAVEEAPPQVVKTALRAAKLIGNGLYGVDLKQVGNKVYVIEVNDNPNIDAGVEDVVLKKGLYRTIMDSFVRRLDARFAP
ncbi:RimK family protein [Endothiovibrio diazotrophicus]